jgi:hypothetical protein
MQKYKLGSPFKLEREKRKEMEYRQGNRNIKKEDGKREREREGERESFSVRVRLVLKRGPFSKALRKRYFGGFCARLKHKKSEFRYFEGEYARARVESIRP